MGSSFEVYPALAYGLSSDAAKDIQFDITVTGISSFHSFDEISMRRDTCSGAVSGGGNRL